MAVGDTEPVCAWVLLIEGTCDAEIVWVGDPVVVPEDVEVPDRVTAEDVPVIEPV